MLEASLEAWGISAFLDAETSAVGGCSAAGGDLPEEMRGVLVQQLKCVQALDDKKHQVRALCAAPCGPLALWHVRVAFLSGVRRCWA